MSELFWPGDRRAGALLSDDAFVAAAVRLEAAWLRALREAGVARDVDPDAVGSIDPDDLAGQVEAGGNPVIPLVQLLRARVPEETGRWLHRGLTSQDVLDSALMLCLRPVLDQVLGDIQRQVAALRELADAHRRSVQAGRTLTQHAVPTTFGLTAATWLTGVLDAADEVVEVRAALPVQAGGAAGTLAAVVALTGDAPSAVRLVETFAADVGLAAVPPWHTNRRPITRIGDALVSCIDAWGGIANDVLVRARPEIGELSEAAPGGSSTMPQKQNPILSVLLRRAAIAAPFAAAQLHAAAAASVDERPDAAWHAEWAALRSLGRVAAVAASQAADLLEGLDVHPDRMRATANAAVDDLLAEQRAVSGDSGGLESYLGAADLLIDRAIERADRFTTSQSGHGRLRHHDHSGVHQHRDSPSPPRVHWERDVRDDGLAARPGDAANPRRDQDRPLHATDERRDRHGTPPGGNVQSRDRPFRPGVLGPRSRGERPRHLPFQRGSTCLPPSRERPQGVPGR